MKIKDIQDETQKRMMLSRAFAIGLTDENSSEEVEAAEKNKYNLPFPEPKKKALKKSVKKSKPTLKKKKR